MSQSKRINWIDIAKAISIYIMVLGHVGLPREINIFVKAFNMPIFFILSGFCFNEKKNNNLNEFLKKRFFSIIIPYLVIGPILYLLLDGIYFLLDQKEKILSFKNLIYRLLYNPANAGAFGVIQWYLVCLFFTELLFFFVCRIMKNNKLKCGITVIVFSIIGYLLSKIATFRLPLATDSMLMAILFYGLGWISRSIEIEKIINYIKNNKIKVFFANIAGLILFGILIFLNGDVDIRTTEYGNYFLYVINAISYSVIIIVFSILFDVIFKEEKIVKSICYIGQNTLAILVFNQFVRYILEIFYLNYVEGLGFLLRAIMHFIIAFIILIICLYFSKLINRYCPILFGKRNSINGG